MESSSYKLSSGQFAKRKYLGEGGFGTVWKCWKKDTKEFVAVKILKHNHNAIKEIDIMTELMELHLDEQNIVKFIGWYKIVFWTKVLVFEMLDMNLKDYCSRFAPLPLWKIRPIIQQVATALGALERIGLIHADIHAKNIMLVDHRSEPLRVKLIDFGTAVHRSDEEPNMSHQIYSYRSPEIILGLPFSEATDMWSLGVVLGLMICGCQLFPGHEAYEVLMFIVIRLGQPADRYLDNGKRMRVYFFKTGSNSWKIKIPLFIRTSGIKFQTLNGLKRRYLKHKEGVEAVEWDQCFELLKAMLKIDAGERITPSDVLAHPFITGRPVQDEPSAPSLKDNDKLNTHPDLHSLLPTVLPGATMIQPPKSEQLKDEKDPKGVLIAIDQKQDCDPCSRARMDNMSTNIQPDQPSPFPSTSPKAFVVRPATPENLLQFGDQENGDRLQMSLRKMSESYSALPSCGDIGTRKKKKKNKIFLRLQSWMERTFSHTADNTQTTFTETL